jgi:hypothetical protein
MKHKDIVGYNGYYTIFEDGSIISNDRFCNSRWGKRRVKRKKLKPKISTEGYLSVALCLDGKRKDWHIHRLLALHFLPNPDKSKQVDHLDGNKLNNDLSNLKFVTHGENRLNEFDKNLRINPKGEKRYNSKAVNQYSNDMVFVAKYKSTGEASRATGIWSENIRRAAAGKVKTAGGYIWKYEEVME